MSLADDGLQLNDRIAWVLERPQISPWLKAALTGARARDPIDVLNELEILNLLLRADCDARIHAQSAELRDHSHSILQ